MARHASELRGRHGLRHSRARWPFSKQREHLKGSRQTTARCPGTRHLQQRPWSQAGMGRGPKGGAGDAGRRGPSRLGRTSCHPALAFASCPTHIPLEHLAAEGVCGASTSSSSLSSSPSDRDAHDTGCPEPPPTGAKSEGEGACWSRNPSEARACKAGSCGCSAPPSMSGARTSPQLGVVGRAGEWPEVRSARTGPRAGGGRVAPGVRRRMAAGGGARGWAGSPADDGKRGDDAAGGEGGGGARLRREDIAAHPDPVAAGAEEAGRGRSGRRRREPARRGRVRETPMDALTSTTSPAGRSASGVRSAYMKNDFEWDNLKKLSFKMVDEANIKLMRDYVLETSHIEDDK